MMELSKNIRMSFLPGREELARQGTVTENVLSLDVIYLQKFELLQENANDEFRAKVEQYAKDLLNGKDVGILFYKVHIFTNRGIKSEDSIRVGDHQLKTEYILHFHAYAVEYLTKHKVDIIGQKCHANLLQGSEDQDIAKLVETQLMIHNSTIPRVPVYV